METGRPNNNNRLALKLCGVVAGMVVLAYASVPLYRIFCQVTGFGGTVREASSAPAKVGSKILEIRFDANTAPDLAWKFTPKSISSKTRVGENSLAFYEVENLTDQAITGMATYNVTPEAAGRYFNKVQCFCFNELTLKPGEKMELPLSYFIDPEIEGDYELKSLRTITLSYTFFKFAGDKSIKD